MQNNAVVTVNTIASFAGVGIVVAGLVALVSMLSPMVTKTVAVQQQAPATPTNG